MPAPHPVRDRVLKYLRFCYPYGDQLLLRDGRCYAYEDVKAVMTSMAETLPDDFLRVLICYAWEPWERVTISEQVDFDSSTVKRKLDAIADMIVDALEPYPSNRVYEGPRWRTLRTSQLSRLRKAWLSQKDWPLWNGDVIPYAVWRDAVKNLEQNAPEYLRVLSMYCRKLEGGRLVPVAKVAKNLSNDSSTIRRKLHVSVDMILQHLRNREVLCREHLFPVLNANEVSVGTRAWPFHWSRSHLR